MSMTNVNRNVVPVESSTTLTVPMLIDGKEILLQMLWNEQVAKGVLMGWTHVEPKNVQALNETTFLATYGAGIMANVIGAAIEKIRNWLGKPVVITCDEVTVAQLHHVWLLQQCNQPSGNWGIRPNHFEQNIRYTMLLGH